MEICQRLQWSPDVIHCNDWHTGARAALPEGAPTRGTGCSRRTRTVLDDPQHRLPGRRSRRTRCTSSASAQHARACTTATSRAGKLNFLKTGVIYADALTTVSETYAREIQTQDFGMGLAELLRARAPTRRRHRQRRRLRRVGPDPRRRRSRSATRRATCAASAMLPRSSCCARMRLAPIRAAPVFGIVSRLTAQKGFELLPEVLPGAPAARGRAPVRARQRSRSATSSTSTGCTARPRQGLLLGAATTTSSRTGSRRAATCS